MVTWSKIITQQLKATEKPNIIDIKSVTIENPKTSCKWSKTIRQVEKVSQGPPAPAPAPPPQKKTKQKNKSWKKEHNAKLQFKDIDSKITNKLKHLLTQLKGFKFVTTLALEFKQIGSDDETKYSTF